MKQRGPKINETHKTLRTGANLEWKALTPGLGNTNDQRYVETGFIKVAFPPGQYSAMIPEVENESVLQQTISFELTHQVADLSIDLLDAIEVTRLGKTKGRGVGLVGGEMNVSGVGPVGLLGKGRFIKMQGTFVSGSEGLHVKKGCLWRGAIAPAGLARGDIPHAFSLDHIVIFFLVVGGVIPGLSKQRWPHAYAFGKLGLLELAMVLKPPSRRENPGHQGGAGHRTNRSVGKCMIKHQTFLAQSGNGWRGSVFVAVELHVVLGVVFGEDENKVGMA